MANQNNRTPRHELYPKALSGELEGSPVIRELLLAMKKMNSTKLVALMNRVIEATAETDASLQDALVPLRERVAVLIKDSQKKNLNSEFDLSVADTLRATVVSKRVQLSEKKSALTKEEEEYSKCVKEMHDIMEQYFLQNLKGLEGLLLHEVFFYDLLSPHRDVSPLPLTFPGMKSTQIFTLNFLFFHLGLRPPLPLRNRARALPPTGLPGMCMLLRPIRI